MKEKISKAFQPGQIYSGATPPGKAPEGYRWSVAERHLTKGYPLAYTLVSSKLEEPPAFLPDDLRELSWEPPLTGTGAARTEKALHLDE